MDLEGVGGDGGEAAHESDLWGRVGQKRVRQRACRVGEAHLLAESRTKEAQALGESD